MDDEWMVKEDGWMINKLLLFFLRRAVTFSNPEVFRRSIKFLHECFVYFYYLLF
jgi:hypothetical protein